jgi:hypothetical protein
MIISEPGVGEEEDWISMYPDAENEKGSLTNKENYVLGLPEKDGEVVFSQDSDEEVKATQVNFLTDTVNKGDIIHAVDLEGSYLEEAWN